MGIKGLSDFLRKRCPTAFMATQLEAYRGLRLAVDVAVYAYKYAYHKTGPEDSDTIVSGFLRQYRTWTERYGIQCTFVFDGPTVAAKMTFEHQRRAKARDALKQKQAEDVGELKEELQDCVGQPGKDAEMVQLLQQLHTVNKRLTVVTSRDYELLRATFTERRIPYVVARGDAEKGCAELCFMDEADVVVTEDYDALVCGAPRVLRNTTKAPEEIHLQTVLDTLGFTQQEFIEFSVLCGSDFTMYLPKMGPVSAYKAIQTYKSIQAYFEQDAQGQRYAREYPEFDYVTAIDLFLPEPFVLPPPHPEESPL